jgi:hypothetical protein
MILFTSETNYPICRVGFEDCAEPVDCRDCRENINRAGFSSCAVAKCSKESEWAIVSVERAIPRTGILG